MAAKSPSYRCCAVFKRPLLRLSNEMPHLSTCSDTLIKIGCLFGHVPKLRHHSLVVGTDDTDFRGVVDSYSDREAGCIFCELGAERIILENELCFAIRDAFPVTEHHTLVIPKRHVADYFDLHQPERNAIEAMLHEQRQSILDQDNTVTGFNVGINAGASAGQTVFHVHVHLIPRRDGDVVDPRGGVRGVIPSEQGY